MSKIRIAAVGIGGYGQAYMGIIEREYGNDIYELVGVVDVTPQNSTQYNFVIKNNIPIFKSMQGLYDSVPNIDLVIISTPIQFHKEQIITAIKHDSYVLCEKPICGSLEEAEEILECCNNTDKFVAIGYQLSYSEVIKKIKQDIMDGLYGDPISFKALILAHRDLRYYARSWAGKHKDSEGRIVNDSIANNACSHQLHNMLFLLGETMQTSAEPVEVLSETYKGNDIETFDTITTKIKLDNGARLLYVASHCAKCESNRFVQEFLFSKGVLCFSNGEYIGKLESGEVIEYGKPTQDGNDKFKECLDAIINNKNVTCDITTAINQTKCIDGVHKSDIFGEKFDKELIMKDDNHNSIYVEGLDNRLIYCYDKECLLSEA